MAEGEGRMTTKLEQYKAAGLKLCPSGCLNEYQYQKHLGGGTFSMKDPTWKRTGTGSHGRVIGHHTCCGSKRSYRHKVGCTVAASLTSDDLSDLKDPS
jgi:hypothetical protein